MKIFLLLIACLFSFSISNVNAQTYVNSGLYNNLIMPTGIQFYGWSSSTSYSILGTGYQNGDEDIDGNKYDYYYTSGVSNDSNGFSLYFNLPESIPANTSLNLDFVFCSTSNANFYNGDITYGVGTGPASALTDNYVPNDVFIQSLGSLETASNTFSQCRRINILFTTPVSGTRFSIRIRSTSIANIGVLAFMGLNSINYGFDYSNQFNDISNQQQITNDKLDDLNNAITDESAPNKLGNLSDSAGWLPAGPVDSILNLPLTMFQNLSNNIGSTCTPLVINLPYVNEDITLPCLNSIYEQIDGLSIWINSIGVIASAFILYSYLLTLYKWVDDTLTFRENNHIDNWGGI